MKPATAIIATQEHSDFTTCQRIIHGIDGLRLVAHCPGLMELFSTVESKPPDLVLISDALTQNENFELIVTLFNQLDVRWIKFSGATGRRRAPSQPERKPTTGDLFSMKLGADDHHLAMRIKSLLWADKRPETSPVAPPSQPQRRYRRMILIGASTGGVDALKTVLSSFGPDCPPTVVVQHTGQGFGSGLAAVLSRTSRAKVTLFSPNIEIEKGTIYIVAGLSSHAVLGGRSGRALMQRDGDLTSGHRPSIDEMFRSAVPLASRTVAAILTGMGRDGVDGLLELRDAGAQTMAQDQASSVVYGMPALAWSSGAAMQQVALKDIGPALLSAAEQ